MDIAHLTNRKCSFLSFLNFHPFALFASSHLLMGIFFLSLGYKSIRGALIEIGFKVAPYKLLRNASTPSYVSYFSIPCSNVSIERF